MFHDFLMYFTVSRHPHLKSTVHYKTIKILKFEGQEHYKMIQEKRQRFLRLRICWHKDPGLDPM